MLTRERKASLLDRLERDGRIVAKDAARELGLSEDTIRRDLRELASAGRLQRVHGGALPASPARADFAGRQTVSAADKVALAKRAATLIEPGQLVFLDGGTTNVALARHFAPDLKITVITHSPSIAVELATHPLIAVELIGGRLFKHSVVAVGASAAHAIGRVRPDLFVLGVTGLHPAYGATTGDAEEAEMKTLIASQSAETMVLASREKIGAASPYLVAPVSDLATIVIARSTTRTVLADLEACGPTIVTV